jgi:YegS/Rv2252/BmrU family lipid kinase
MEPENKPIKYQKMYFIMNPAAGSAKDELRPAIEARLQEAGQAFEIYETTGEENVPEVARRACQQGADLVIAAGGDGTVSGVVNGLIHADVPLGIIPAGTGNGLARAMGIPLDPKEALELLVSDHAHFTLDAMQTGNKYYILNVSAGISSRAMKNTSSAEKQRLGMLAYVRTILGDIFQPQRDTFHLRLDGRTLRVRAAEVLVANGTVLSEPPFLFGPRETYSDGVFEVNILTARETKDYVKLALNLLLDPQKGSDEVQDFTVHRDLRLDVPGRRVSVQADGELIGQTPVEIKIVPGALKVVVPAPQAEQPSENYESEGETG